MEIKKLNLSKQYFVNALIFLMLLIVAVTSRQEFVSQEYQSIITKCSNIILLLCGLSGLLKQEKEDESAEKILNKVNKMNTEITSIGLIILAIIVGAPTFKTITLTRDSITILILFLLFMTRLFKAVLFVYYDRRGL